MLSGANLGANAFGMLRRFVNGARINLNITSNRRHAINNRHDTTVDLTKTELGTLRVKRRPGVPEPNY